MPPSKNILKVARHSYGYLNPTQILDPDGSGKMITVSLPLTTWDTGKLSNAIPQEGLNAVRGALEEMIPSLAKRKFTMERICWYTDTPTGDFLITHHPRFANLVLATGGSGHGYKFLPAIGSRIVDLLEGTLDPELASRWAWRAEAVEEVVTEDGTRGGRPGLVLKEELAKMRSKL